MACSKACKIIGRSIWTATLCLGESRSSEVCAVKSSDFFELGEYFLNLKRSKSFI